jgi:hypothetical protein
MQKMLADHGRFVARLIGVALLCVVVTGQGSADGCAEVPGDEPVEATEPDSRSADPGAEEVATTAPAPVSGAWLPLGEYQCFDTYTQMGSSTRVSYKEVLTIVDDQTYRYRPDGPTGEYRYDPGTGDIDWISGPYSGGNPTARFDRNEDGREVITLSYEFENLGSDRDYCRRKISE